MATMMTIELARIERFAHVAEHDVDRSSGDQQQEHRFDEHLARDRENRPRLVARQLVRSIRRQASRSLRGSQATVCVCTSSACINELRSHLSGCR